MARTVAIGIQSFEEIRKGNRLRKNNMKQHLLPKEYRKKISVSMDLLLKGNRYHWFYTS